MKKIRSSNTWKQWMRAERATLKAAHKVAQLTKAQHQAEVDYNAAWMRQREAWGKVCDEYVSKRKEVRTHA